jgi:hypothetical protein
MGWVIEAAASLSKATTSRQPEFWRLSSAFLLSLAILTLRAGSPLDRTGWKPVLRHRLKALAFAFRAGRSRHRMDCLKNYFPALLTQRSAPK